MRITPKHVVLSCLLVLCLCSCSIAQAAGQIRSMKLLTADTGWAATDHKLFWTTDNGSHWKDITPKLNHKRQMVSSVFFLDASRGWILLHCGDDKDTLVDDVCFEFASTTDAGGNWSVVHPNIVDPGIDRSNVEDGVGAYSGAAFLNFADTQHGWAILKKSYNAARSVGEMFRTVDGGRSWIQLAHDTPPIAEHFRFINSRSGWMTGGPDSQLYVTHDGGDTWRATAVPPRPRRLGPDRGTAYDLPFFTDEDHGALCARYETGPELGPVTSTLVLYSTKDEGKTWHESTAVPGLPDNYGPGLTYPSTITGSALITAAVSGRQIEIRSAGPGAEQAPQLADMPVRTNHAPVVSSVSFLDQREGWVLAGYWIVATDDGGTTWRNITPEPAETVPPLAFLAPAKRALLSRFLLHRIALQPAIFTV